VPFHFFQVKDEFVKEFRHILIGTQAMRITKETLNFLDGKGFHMSGDIFLICPTNITQAMQLDCHIQSKIRLHTILSLEHTQKA
jgi:hypothetical protein